MAANGQLVFTDVDKVTFKGVGNTSNAVIDTTTGKIGVGVDSPDANLHVLGNCFVSTNLELGGTMTMGTVTVNARHELSAITATGNTTPHTVEFQNATTGLVTTGNVEVGGDISISSNLKMNDVVFINATGERAVAVGYQAGETGQGVNTVAVGYQAGQTSQTFSATAVGNLAGQTSQSDSAVAIGGQAGQTSQGAYSVAVGQLAGASSQQGRATAVGYLAGNSTQGQDATAIGYQAGKTSQSTKAVAVGVEAGKTDQGVNAIAVGYLAGETDQGDNSIILNATGVALDSTTASSFHVKPVRGGNFAASALAYTSTGEIVEETNMHFDTAGNVGIGTTDPGNPLVIYGPDQVNTFNAQCAISSNSTTGVINSGGTLLFQGHDGVNARGWATVSGLKENGTSGNYASYLRFDTRSSGASVLTERMRITSSGNVGIGTGDPSSKLTVNQIPQHRNTYDHSLAPMTITNRISTSNATLNDPRHVLNLAREGTSGEAYGARATFKLSRWENSGTGSRTRLDLDVAHDSYNEVTVMKWYSNGGVVLSSGNAVQSDDRIKYNEEDIPNALETLNKLKPQKYEKLLFAPEKTGKWIPSDNDWDTLKLNDGYTWINEYGFIAQDVKNIPELAFLVSGEEMQIDTKTSAPEEYSNLTTEEQSTYTLSYVYESNTITQSEYSNLTPEEQGLCSTQYTKQIETQTPLALNYQGLFVVAIGAIKELKTQLATVLARLDALENA